jgi:hypothetical protein
VTLIRLSSQPQVVFSTYFGGSQFDQIRDAYIDGQGNVYIAGRTESTDLPTTSGVVQRNFGGAPQDGFIAKFSSSGALLFCTYVGGSSQDNAYAIFVDGSGSIYIGGRTASTNFPATAGAFQTTYGGGTSGFPFFGGDVFVAKLSPDASSIMWATYIGGSDDDTLRGRLTVDSAGNVYGQGDTRSQNFPIASAVQTSRRGSIDAVLFKLSADGSRLIYSTYFGGFEATGEDGQGGVTISPSGDAYFCGFTTASSGFPVTQGAYQTTLVGTQSTFVARLSPTGSLVASTLLGGSSTTECQGLEVDAAGNPVVLNATRSPNYPTTQGAFQTATQGDVDLAVTKFAPNLSAASGLMFSTFVGGPGNDAGDTLRVQVDSSNNVYFVGSTGSSSFPVSTGAIQTTYAGGPHDLLFVKLSPDGSQVLYATFIGGSGEDYARSIRYRRL